MDVYSIEACIKAKDAILSNYPPENYTTLRIALDMSISLLNDKIRQLVDEEEQKKISPN